MMKILIILFALITSFTVDSTTLKRKVNLVKSKTALPFELVKGTSRCASSLALNSELSNYLSFHAYKDIGEQEKIWDSGNYVTCSIFQRFRISDKKIELLDLDIDLPEFFRHVLLTLDSNYQPIDTLEVAFGSSLIADGPYAYFKQYRLSKSLELDVYQLIPAADKIIECYPNVIHADLQRVDTRYVIDENGKFVKKRETRYKPQTYDLNKLCQKEYNIWNGTEIPLETP